MSAVPFEFEAPFTAEVIDHAATAFVRQYLFRKYGRWLVLACVVNAVGFFLALWLGANDPLVLAWVGAIVVLGPLYLVFVYVTYPGKFAARLKKLFLPSAHFSVSSESFGVRTSAGSATIPWSRVKSVLEFPSYLILVFSPFAFSVLPKAALPPEAYQILREKSSSRVVNQR